MGALLSIAWNAGVNSPIGFLFKFAQWFYLTFIPFVLQYIGIPLFALGVLLALAFAGGTILFIVIFCISIYIFIKGTIFNSKPTIK